MSNQEACAGNGAFFDPRAKSTKAGICSGWETKCLCHSVNFGSFNRTIKASSTFMFLEKEKASFHSLFCC
jgi:hypothetical protein